jgi:hypothetical protein
MCPHRIVHMVIWFSVSNGIIIVDMYESCVLTELFTLLSGSVLQTE